MAVPSTMTVKTLSGSFFLNKELSDSQDELLAIQGIPYPIRQIAKCAKVKVQITVTPETTGEKVSSETLDRLKITMTSSVSKLGPMGAAPLKAVGIPTKKTDIRYLDGTEFTQEEPFLGNFIARVWISSIAELEEEEIDDFLKLGWREGPDDCVIRMSVRSSKTSDADFWYGEHVWGFQPKDSGSGRKDLRYTGRVCAKKGTGLKRQEAHAKLVYDYDG